jgi:hypothetical protein
MEPLFVGTIAMLEDDMLISHHQSALVHEEARTNDERETQSLGILRRCNPRAEGDNGRRDSADYVREFH